jgi:predicted ATPase
MFIRRFGVWNFKIHKDTSLDLFPITVFVGPNSGGKSALFDALINFSMVCRGNLSEAFNQYPFSFDALRHHGASHSARIRYSVELSADPQSAETLHYSIEFSQNPGTEMEPTYAIHNEELSVGSTLLFSRSKDVCKFVGLSFLDFGERSIFAAIRRSEWSPQFSDSHPLVAMCAREISRIGRYRLDPALLARAGRVLDVKPGESEPASQTPWLSYRGEDLASVLYFLSETGSPILGEIAQRVAEGIQGFEGFGFNRVGSDRVGFSARFSDKRGAVVAPNLSDGCLAMIGLVTLALAPGRPATLCIEEPENGLTPKATRVFYSTVREIVEPTSGQRAQVLLSSHSPFVIVDAWNGEERDFIYQCHPSEGMAEVVKFSDAVQSGGNVLRKGGEIGLALAEQVMDGFRFQP